MAGKGRFKMGRQMKRESEALSSAGSKQSSWSKLGMGLGGLLAMGLTGGAATPLVAGMMAGGGTLAGGLLGRGLARGTKGGRMRGGRFYRDEAAKWKSDIGEEIWSGAAKAGLKGGMGALAKGFSFGKEGLKFTGGKLTPDSLLKGGEATGTYSDSLWGKLGETIDFKGSAIGQQRHIQNLWNKPDLMEFAEAQGPQDPGIPDLGELFEEEMGLPSIEATDDLDVLRAKANSAQNIVPSNIRGQRTEPGAFLKDKFGNIPKAKGPQEIYQNAEGLYSTSIPEPSASSGGVLSGDERSLYDIINKQTEAGYAPTWDKASGYHELSEEMGRGFIDKSGNIVRQPDRPDVPLDIVEDDFSMGDKDRLGSITMIDTGEAYPGDTGLWDMPPPKGADTIPEGFRGGPTGNIRLKDKGLGSSLLEQARGQASTRPTLTMQTGGENASAIKQFLGETGGEYTSGNFQKWQNYEDPFNLDKDSWQNRLFKPNRR